MKIYIIFNHPSYDEAGQIVEIHNSLEHTERRVKYLNDNKKMYDHFYFEDHEVINDQQS